jgi:hypothetical protein
MTDNQINLEDIITQMEITWVTNCCVERKGIDPCPDFIFGYPQDVDDLHTKKLPLMVCNIPTSTSVADEYERNVVNNTTVFKIQIYQYEPSRYAIPNDLIKAKLWDDMENCFYFWLNMFLIEMGSKVVLGNGVVQITRRTQSSNDQLLQIECTFNLNYYRWCGFVEYP